VNGIVPAKRYTYSARKAWIKSGSGYGQASGPPIHLLTEIRLCRSTSMKDDGTCEAAADAVITRYEYGQDDGSAPNNLLLKGVSVTADGQTLRTCYGYDALGRKISETAPEANLAVCP
jgi:YD repeat-containing protein